MTSPWPKRLTRPLDATSQPLVGMLATAATRSRRPPAGSRVMLIWGAANHDDREFAEPGRFDITRTVTKHLAFGHGPHYCLGANLARLQVHTVLRELFTRLPDIEVSGEARHMQSSFMNGIKHLPVRFTPAEVAELNASVSAIEILGQRLEAFTGGEAPPKE